MNSLSPSDVDIKYEDQIKINEFSKLYQKRNEVNQELTKLEEAVKKIQDCLSELEMTIEDQIDYQFAECFIATSTDEAKSLTENRFNELTEQMKLQSSLRGFITKRLGELKAQLYAKFGNNINLEE